MAAFEQMWIMARPFTPLALIHLVITSSLFLCPERRVVRLPTKTPLVTTGAERRIINTVSAAPLSVIDLLHFSQRCYQFSNLAYFALSTDLDFECLATWKDGSDMFMYGGFASPGTKEKNDIYRCFVSIITPDSQLGTYRASQQYFTRWLIKEQLISPVTTPRLDKLFCPIHFMGRTKHIIRH